MPDRYPDQYGSLGPHVYSGQAPHRFQNAIPVRTSRRRLASIRHRWLGRN